MSDFLVVVSGWRNRQQSFAAVRSFLRLQQLQKLVVGRADLSMGDGWVRSVLLGHGVFVRGLNLSWNIPLIHQLRLTCNMNQKKDR